jgi:hypothetical protein
LQEPQEDAPLTHEWQAPLVARGTNWLRTWLNIASRLPTLS